MQQPGGLLARGSRPRRGRRCQRTRGGLGWGGCRWCHCRWSGRCCGRVCHGPCLGCRWGWWGPVQRLGCRGSRWRRPPGVRVTRGVARGCGGASRAWGPYAGGAPGAGGGGRDWVGCVWHGWVLEAVGAGGLKALAARGDRWGRYGGRQRLSVLLVGGEYKLLEQYIKARGVVLASHRRTGCSSTPTCIQ